MKFQFTIDLSNAAFEGRDGPQEVARLLEAAARQLRSGEFLELTAHSKQAFRDVNGNRVGEWKTTGGKR